MLDLQPGVDLEEVELPLVADEELGRTGALVAGRSGERQRGIAQPAPQPVVDDRRRGLLDHLLVPPLQRALALAQVNRMPVAVSQELDLDVVRPRHVVLDHQPLIAECRGRLAARPGQGLAQVSWTLDEMHSLAAPACARLEQHRVPDAARLACQPLITLCRSVVPGQHRHSHGFGQAPCRRLVAQRAHRSGWWANPDQVGVDDRLREARVLGEEAVAGVECVGARHASGRDDGICVQVRGVDEGDGFVGRTCPPGACLVLRDECQAGDAELPTAARDAHDQLTAVGDQQAGDPPARSRAARECRGKDLGVRADADGRQPAFTQPALDGTRAHAQATRRFSRTDRVAHDANVAFVVLSVNRASSTSVAT